MSDDRNSQRPLRQYNPKGYVAGVTDAHRARVGDIGKHNQSDEHRALDAAVHFTAAGMGPPFATRGDTAGEWWSAAYDAACKAVESAIVRGLTDGVNGGSE